MITRAQMPRQLRDKGGIASVTPRENYGLGSKIKDRFRKLIPNELADVAVAAAPFVAPFNPGIAGLMRGIGRFDQRGSISDALKQGAATFGFGAGARALGGADPFGGGLKGGFTSPLDAEKTTKFKTLFERQKADIDLTKTKDKPGFLRKAAEETIGKVPVLQNLSPKVQEKLLAGTITSGASALYSYFTGEFEPQQPGETVGEYLARRNERVKLQMRQVMDSYYTPLRNPEYAAMTPEQKNNFIDGLVGQAGLKGTTDFQGEARATGGRVGYQTGGITMANTLAENIARNRAAQSAFQQSIAPAQERVREQIKKRTPVQEYAMSDDSILGPLSKKAASTIMAGQDKSQAALDVLNKTMTPTGITATDTGQAIRIGSGVPEEYDSLNKAFTAVQAPTQDSNSVPVGTRLISDGRNRYAVRPDGSLSFINTVTPNEKDYIDNFNKGPVEGYKFIGNQQYSDPSVGLNLSGNFLEFTGYGDERKGDGNFKYLQDIDQTGMPRAITQDDIDTFNFIPPKADTDPMLVGFDYSKEINWSPGQPAPEGYRVVNMMGDEFLERKFPSKEEVARLPMPLLNAPEDPDAGLSGQEYAEKYGIPYALGGRVGFSEGANLKIKLKQIGYEDTLLDKLSLKELRELLDSEKGTFTDQGTYREPAKKGGMPTGIMKTNKAGVMERDYRDKGGFVPVGIKEKADDVPAMLSKNEFVFTADAVRGAGNGSIEKGAQRMYDTMKNLEKRVT
jgi:hypothetical protein